MVLFNSNFNRDSFLHNIPKILKLLPDYKPKNLQNEIESKSRVLYFPISYPNISNSITKPECLHIVWPHRWEFDKAPEEFFDVLYKLKNNNYQFVISVLGENFSDVPDVFNEANTFLKEHILNFGFVKSKEEYYHILRRAHVVVSTANHEFFGVSM